MAIRTSAIDVVLRMRGTRTFAAQAKATAASLESMGVRGARAMGSIATAGAKMQAFGSRMTKSVGLPLAAGFAYAGYKALQFNESMTKVTTQAGVTTKATEDLQNRLLSFATSGQAGQTPQAMSEALFHVASQGYRGADAMEVLKAAVEGADVSGADLTDTTQILGKTMKAFGIDSGKSRATMSQFNSIVGQGDLTMQDLLTTLQTGVVPIAGSAQLKLQDLGGAIDTLVTRNFTAAKAGTGLKMAIGALLHPTDTAAAAMKSVGINADTVSKTIQQPGGLIKALSYMKDRMDKSGESAKTIRPLLLGMFGGSRSGAAALTLLDHMGALRKATQGATADVTTWDKAVAKWAETPAAKLEKAKAQLEGYAILIGQQVLPMFVALLGVLSGALKFFEKLPAPVREFGKWLAYAAVVGGPLIWVLGTLGKMFLPIMKLIGLIRGLGVVMSGTSIAFEVGAASAISFDIAVLAIPLAIVAVAAALVILYLKVKWFRDKVNAVFDFIKTHWRLLLIVMTAGAAAPFIAIADHFGAIKQAGVDAFHWIKTAGQNTFGWLKTAAGNVGGWFSGAWHGVANTAKTAFTAVKNTIIDALNGIIDAINVVIRAVNFLPGPDIGEIGNIDTGPTFHSSLATKLSKGHGSIARHTQNILDLPKKAMGGAVLPGGTALVGERGPELATFPYGGNVFAHDQTKQLLASARDQQTIVIPIHLNGKVIAQEVVRAGETAKARR